MNNLVCGDTHGRVWDTKKLSSKYWKEQKELTKEDVLFQLGDFGWVWYPFGENAEQEYWLDNLAARKYTLAVVLGNHENYNVINTLPIETKWEGPVRVLKRKTGNIYFLERGYVYTVNGKKIFAFGGAQSNHRPDNQIVKKNIYTYGNRSTKNDIVEGKNWWKQEIPTKEEMDRGIKNLEEHNWKVDYVFTHTCPRSIVLKLKENIEKEDPKKWNKNIGREDDPVSIYLEELHQKIEFKYLCFGHFHIDYSLDIGDKTYMCFYEETPLNLTEFEK